MMTISTLADSNELYRLTHKQHPEFFAGFSIMEYVFEIGQLVKQSNISTALDYGCGKARAWKERDLQRLWKLSKVGLYDPGVDQYSTKPEGKYDLVLCMDVMEHIPEHLVDEVLADICSYACKAVFFNICTRPASKVLVDGSNAHATVRTKQWWQKKIDSLDVLAFTYYT
jgi:hypothetical protein